MSTYEVETSKDDLVRFTFKNKTLNNKGCLLTIIQSNMNRGQYPITATIEMNRKDLEYLKSYLDTILNNS